MKLFLVTDAWRPQVNGVVRTLETVVGELVAAGARVRVIHPGDGFRTIPCPSYPEIRLALMPRRRIARALDEFRPESVHIATEGPLGRAARAECLARGLRFTTSFHTKFPEYVETRFRIPAAWSYRMLGRFHAPATRVMVATGSVEGELREHGFVNTARWSRGVDTSLFRPQAVDLGLPRPIHLTVGRVAPEKNIEAFLELELPGTKLVVGDGPARRRLEAQFKGATFVGAKHGEDLARHYAAADVFVFPSRTDTFGLVQLEALACGVPVAAYPVPGPLDVLGGHEHVGALDDDLSSAIARARGLSRQDCREFALRHSWAECAALFQRLLAPAA